jgi:hypothetical protein
MTTAKITTRQITVDFKPLQYYHGSAHYGTGPSFTVSEGPNVLEHCSTLGAAVTAADKAAYQAGRGNDLGWWVPAEVVVTEAAREASRL